MTEQQKRDRSPAGRFKYLAEKRVGKAIKAIASISNLSDRKNYEYTEDQVSQIMDALTNELELTRKKFESFQTPSTNRFKLK
ncbi:hypothetical protein NYF23_01995 [SAR92 clade bacterium H455]|jgi:hypothetical protein|uniref:Uncharacterized protein n=1 Tax=SAR92 clade bacterium H455 TaxID=2974818 RepID=A0ABY5TNG4_9GAMM|nr:hypothetical protein NYF23_01995 [SAR92 clade bacterium H455]